MIKAVVIDDIELARASLIADIKDYCPEVSIEGEADGVLSGLKLIKNVKPELVFLDIQMADGEGFDILELLDMEISVIFTTASETHAIKAFQHNAIDYLLKPIDHELLIKAISKHIERNGKQEPLRLGGDSISLNTLEDIRKVKILDIVRCESDGNYTTIFERNGHKTMISKSLKSIEERLANHGFYRTHQSHLVALRHIRSYLKTEGGFLEMVDGSEVPVSVRKKAEVVRLLTGKK